MQRSVVSISQKLRGISSSAASSPIRSLKGLKGTGSVIQPPPLRVNRTLPELVVRSVSTADQQQASTQDPFQLVGGELGNLVEDIHRELEAEILSDCELLEISQYYFDGKGKFVRPIISLCLGQAFNMHTDRKDSLTLQNQRKVAIISEMIHTASLFHDDVIDHAETRRGKPSVNLRWDMQKSTMAGDYVLAVGSKILARIGNPDVVQILSQVLADLVEGEFMQMQTKDDEAERFQHYLDKSFNKTASLMAYSCKANAVLAGATPEDVENAFQYGRNIGIAFQLVDDLLDFVSSADMLGKPAAADLQLGLATAPVLFAARKFPELDILIARRFSEAGDVTKAFQLVIDSDGLEETKRLATKLCHQAVAAVEHIKESPYKSALVVLCDKVINRLA